MEEIWKDISGFEGLYQVSNFGRVKSFYKHKTHAPGSVIQGSINTKGYQCVNLYKKDNKASKRVHQLVAQAFIDNPENKPQVNHIDGVKTNNRVDNLEWCTNTENSHHAFRTGLIKPLKGESNGRAKLTEKDVIIIRALHQEGVDYKILTKVFPVNNATMHKIISNQLWKHLKQAS